MERSANSGVSLLNYNDDTLISMSYAILASDIFTTTRLKT